MSFLQRLFGGTKGIGMMCATRDIAGLVAALDDSRLRQEATEALLGFGGSALEALLASNQECNARAQRAAVSSDFVTTGDYLRKRQVRVEVLGKLRDPRVIRPLLDALADGIEIDRVTQDTWKRIQDEEIMRLADPSYQQSSHRTSHLAKTGQLMHQNTMLGRALGQAAADALNEIGIPAVQQIVAALRADSRPAVRHALAVVLASIGGREVQTVMTGLLQDPDENVRRVAEETLQR